jgi:tetratricopeptide (TPR) repeat protein
MYRGLPMVEEISFKEKEQMLLESVTIANNIVPSNKLEQIILKENKVTLFQTMHKWYLNKKDFHNAEEYIQKIITLDPFDSNPYRVYGFFLMDLEKYAEAANYFELAHHKGPPMVAMNLYYYAKCLELVGKFDISDIVGLLCDVSKFDAYALSPWLDLFNIYVEQKDTIKATAISKHIMKTKDLYEQLTQDEYEQFKGCSNE